MKRIIILLAVAIMTTSCSILANLDAAHLMSGAAKAATAASITDEQVQAYMRQYVVKLDASSRISPSGSAYSKRLANLTRGLDEVDGIPLNFKVYEVNQVNAFACADGSVRVYTGLMDLMTDDELLGVIGHEMGHIALRHSKKEIQNAYLTSAVLDGISSTSATIASLTDSQLGAIGEAALGARYSKKQEYQADDYGYEFLKAHGRNPAVMIQGFRKMLALKNAAGASSSSAVNQLFATHPELEDRISRMTQKALAEGYIKVNK